jgi:type II secretory pathway component PulF
MQAAMSAHAPAGLVGWLRWRVSPLGRAAAAFRSKRHDYYSYLAALLVDARGKKTMLDIFRADATRYEGKPRGVLTQHWADRHHDGANLLDTWEGTLPEADLMVLGAAVAAGGPGAMEAALADVARLAKRAEESKRQFLSTVVVGLFAMALAVSVVLGLPLFFVPLLKSSFHFVPLEMWGPLGQRMLKFAAFIGFAWPFVMFAALGLVSAAWLALPRWTGRLRAWLDARFLPYRLYRDARAAEFLATLAAVLKRRGNVSLNMREGLELIRARATPWLAEHCTRMLFRLDEPGEHGAEVLETGLLGDDSLYYVVDMMESLGPDEGLQVAGLRVESQIQETLTRSAKVLRIAMMLAGVAIVFGMAAWLMGIIGELKAATALVFSK